MPEYTYTVNYRDIRGGERPKTFKGDFADYATARAAADALLTDLQNATNAAIYREALTEVNQVAGTANAGSNVFLVASATVTKLNSEKANFKLYSPVAAMQDGNALLTGDASFTNVTDNFASDWFISDDEYIATSQPMRGRIRMESSGKTNLL